MDQGNHKCIISLVDSSKSSPNLRKPQYNSKSYEPLSYHVEGTTGQLYHVVSRLCITGLCEFSYRLYLKGPWKHKLLILIKQEETVCVITWTMHILITCSMTQLPGGKYQEATTWKIYVMWNCPLILYPRQGILGCSNISCSHVSCSAGAIHFSLMRSEFPRSETVRSEGGSVVDLWYNNPSSLLLFWHTHKVANSDLGWNHFTAGVTLKRGYFISPVKTFF